MNAHTRVQVSVESSPFMFHYIITEGQQASGVVFLTLTDKVCTDGISISVVKSHLYHGSCIMKLISGRLNFEAKAWNRSFPTTQHHPSRHLKLFASRYTPQTYPKKLAHQYLDELATEFNRTYLGQIEGAQNPYQFIKFGASLFTRFHYFELHTAFLLDCAPDSLSISVCPLMSCPFPSNPSPTSAFPSQ